MYSVGYMIDACQSDDKYVKK